MGYGALSYRDQIKAPAFLRKFRESFYLKIAFVLLSLLATAGVLLLLTLTLFLKTYADETEQTLNGELAKTVADELKPLVERTIDYPGVEQALYRFYELYPRYEIYLLLDDGTIALHLREPSVLKRSTIDTQSIRKFLSAGSSKTFPIYGDDPLSANGKSIFSAAEILLGGRKAYVYVSFSTPSRTTVLYLLEQSYIVRAGFYVLFAVITLTALIGLFLFSRLTTPLRSMAATVRAFSSNISDERITRTSEDELGQLGRAFNQMADTIQANMEKLKTTDALRRELVANVSHDLRVPLTSVYGNLETLLIEETVAPEDRKQLIETALRNVEFLRKLVGELFELSKLNAREVSPKYSTFVVEDLVDYLMFKFEPVAGEHQIQISASSPPGVEAIADKVMLERALSNLLENAVVYNQPGGSVQLVVKDERDEVSISVSDTGVGIDAAELPRIFERFYRATKGATNRSGTGLGLAITQKIVEAHGGTITVESTLGQGSTFLIHLPKDLAKMAAVQPSSEVSRS